MITVLGYDALEHVDRLMGVRVDNGTTGFHCGCVRCEMHQVLCFSGSRMLLAWNSCII